MGYRSGLRRLIGLGLWRAGVAMVAAVALLCAAQGVPAALADSAGTLTIQIPAQPEGPVGTNLTVAAQDANPGDTYQLGYASGSSDCTSGFHAIANATAQAGADGTFTTTFAWPSQANHVGTHYAVCAQDKTTSGQVLQSSQAFVLDASAAPSISVTAPAPGQGTPTPAKFTPGGEVIVQGRSFFPGGQALEALVLGQKATSPGQLNEAVTLTLPDHTTTQFSADGPGDTQGSFQVHLLLPSTVAPGKAYLYVVTTDGTAAALPALAAYTTITISAATPTPTATATATPVTPTPTTTATSTGNNNSGGTGKDIAVFALGGLSALLLVLGIIFLASAATLPRPDQGYGRPGPGQSGPSLRP